VEEGQEKIKKLQQAISRILKNGRVNRYVLSKPVSTFKQAQEAIAELLEKTEQA